MADGVLTCVILGNILFLDHPNSMLVSLLSEQPCQALAGVGGGRGEEAGYPVQQSKSPCIQEHPTEERERVLQRDNPQKAVVHEFSYESNFISQTER